MVTLTRTDSLDVKKFFTPTMVEGKPTKNNVLLLKGSKSP